MAKREEGLNVGSDLGMTSLADGSVMGELLLLGTETGVRLR